MAKTVIRYRTRKVKHAVRRHFTPQKVLKWTIALAPVTAFAISQYQKAGGGVNGLSAGINAVSSSYSGYDITTGQIQTQNLAIGYVPLFFAWIFGKVSSRVLR